MMGLLKNTPRHQAFLVLGSLALLLAVACGSAATTTPPASPSTEESAQSAGPQAGAETPATGAVENPHRSGGRVGDHAPEFQGIANWINSEPLTMADLRGKVVLVDFWTYTCVNCIRTFPYLKLWHARYASHGLVIVGVHTPEFEFEKDTDNVIRAAEENSIVWPVAQDNDFATWDSYSNRFWPAKYLIDHQGMVRYTHFGEGAYGETEEQIRELLAEAGAGLTEEYQPLSDQAIDPVFLELRNAELTRELYAGYERGYVDALYGQGGYVRQPEFYLHRDEVVYFEAPEDLSPHYIYFNGFWLIGPEHAKHGQASSNYEDYIAVVYSARSVNAVLTSDSGEAYKVRVTLDGEYLTEETSGEDIIIGDDGESYLWVTEPRMYRIIEKPNYMRRKALQLSSDSADFGLFAFTFGVYQEGG